MEQGDQEGMQTFDGVIEQLIRKGVVTREMAMPYATNANNLLLRISDMDATPKTPQASASQDEPSMLDLIEK